MHTLIIKIYLAIPHQNSAHYKIQTKICTKNHLIGFNYENIVEMSILFFRDKTIDETHPPRRAHSQQGPERLELPMLSEGRMQRAYSQEAEVPLVLQPLTSPHGGGKTRVKS